jgi:hypothetical protein
MCAGKSCATCDLDDLAVPCEHTIDERHLGGFRDEPARGRRNRRNPKLPFLADRIEVDPADPDSVAHFLETWAQIVRTRRRFIIIVQ